MKADFFHSDSGFTIVELMIGIAVLAVLMSLAVPSYQAFVKNNCMTTTSASLVVAFQLARSEAVKRRQDVSIRAKSGAWNNGWQVMHGGTILRDFGRDSCDNTTITETDSGSTEFTYRPTGLVNDDATLSICDDRDNNNASSPGRQVSISLTGRPHTDSRYTGGACT